jgi:hypothetical protein
VVRPANLGKIISARELRLFLKRIREQPVEEDMKIGFLSLVSACALFWLIQDPDQNLPATVRVKHGQNRRRKTLHYYLNYAIDSRTFDCPYAAGTKSLAQSGLEHGQKIALKPWDAAIVEEK